jgi:hypothetical protein
VPTNPVSRPRRRRWWIALAVLAAVLALYIVAIGWFAQRLRETLGESVQPAPAIEDRQHRRD